jgi:hypothetical protein
VAVNGSDESDSEHPDKSEQRLQVERVRASSSSDTGRIRLQQLQKALAWYWYDEVMSALLNK